MATNGESARQWLEANRDQATPERLQRIWESITKKIDCLDPEDPAIEGLEEARAVMEAQLHQQESEQAAPEHSLDTSPLGEPSGELPPQLSSEEKRKRFEQLLAEQNRVN